MEEEEEEEDDDKSERINGWKKEILSRPSTILSKLRGFKELCIAGLKLN